MGNYMYLPLFLSLIPSDTTICLLCDDAEFVFGFRQKDVDSLKLYLGLEFFENCTINEINLGHHNNFNDYVDSFDYVLDVNF